MDWLCRITYSDQTKQEGDGAGGGPVEDSGRAPVVVDWKYSATAYEPVTLKCGDSLVISWERGVHNLIQDATGAPLRTAFWWLWCLNMHHLQWISCLDHYLSCPEVCHTRMSPPAASLPGPAAADCASEGSELLAPGSKGAYTFRAEEDGEVFFRCSLSDHCFEFGGNMNLQVTMSGC
jgi:hypothetical protein